MKYLIVAVLIFGWTFADSQNPMGKIIFENGDELEFSNVDYHNIFLKSNWGKDKTTGIPVYYENTNRVIPLSKIDYFKIDTWQEAPSDKSEVCLHNFTATVTTKTGIAVTSSYYAACYIDVRLYDKLTGEMVKQRIDFAFLSKRIKIRAIDFY